MSTVKIYKDKDGNEHRATVYGNLNGYIRIVVLDTGEFEYEHRYVWELANGQIPKGCHIHHIDGNKANNNISNLECILGTEHNRMTLMALTKEERVRRAKKGNLTRMQHGNGTFEHTIEVFNVELNKKFPSAVDAAQFVGGKKQHILNALMGRCRTAYGYHWIYANEMEDK